MPTPEPGHGEVRLRVAATGLCHSDVFIKEAPPALGMSLPVTLGHEVVGYVDAIGTGASGLREGQLVAVYVLLGCGQCVSCRRGQDNLCHRGYRGIGTHVDGGLADYIVVPAGNALDADGLEPVAAAPLTDAALTAYHAVSTATAAVPDASNTVIIGIGGLGHMGLQALRATTSATVIAVDVDETKLELARRLGATHVVDGRDAARDAILDLAGGREVDAVIDFVGTQPTVDLAAAVTNRGSAIVIAGLGGGQLCVKAESVTELSPETMVRRVAAGSRSDLVEVLRLARSGALRAETETFALDNAAEALSRLDQGSIVGRAVVVPN